MLISEPTNPLDGVPLSPEAKKLLYEEFYPRYKELVQQIERTPLVVLVWGPGACGGELYQKRLQIRATLREIGLAALFSEEVPHAGPSLRADELMQAVLADFIVLLQVSPGSIAEAHDVGAFLEQIGRKMLIFIDKRTSGGYSYEGMLMELNELYGNVHRYTYPDDIDACRLSEAVLRKVRILQYAKWRHKLSREAAYGG